MCANRRFIEEDMTPQEMAARNSERLNRITKAMKADEESVDWREEIRRAKETREHNPDTEKNYDKE